MYTKKSSYFTEERFSSSTTSSSLKRSQTAPSVGNCQIIAKRGFKPSDRFDPQKKAFLVDLSNQIWRKNVNVRSHSDIVYSRDFDSCV
jgi:hypothetical protein